MIRELNDDPNAFGNRQTIVDQLRFISTTIFSGQYCKNQANKLIQLLGNAGLEEKRVLVDEYINLISVRNAQNSGIFRLTGRNIDRTRRSHLERYSKDKLLQQGVQYAH